MHHHEWGWMIVVYLFLGGLGAGSLVISSAAHLTRRGSLLDIVHAGAVLAAPCVAAGSLLLLFDLGRPEVAWKLFTHLNVVSPMSVGSWLLMVFLAVAAIHALLHVRPDWLEALAARRLGPPGALRRLAEWNRAEWSVRDGVASSVEYPGSPARVRQVRRAVAAIGVPLGLGVGIYTGVLLGAIPARPFWNTPMVAQLFLFSALSTASALLLLALPVLSRRSDPTRPQDGRMLLRLDLVFIVLELFLIVPYVIHGQLSTLSARTAQQMILGGPYTMVFWFGVVAFGILAPMLLELIDLSGVAARVRRPLRWVIHYGAPVLVLFGGYLLRWVFVHAGQDTHFI